MVTKKRSENKKKIKVFYYLSFEMVKGISVLGVGWGFTVSVSIKNILLKEKFYGLK